jgi:hypothetical protein
LSKISRAGSLYANNLISKIAITNSIHIEAHMGSVDGTNVIWAPNLADNLSRNAEDYDVRRNVMESSTEHVGGSAPTQKQQATALCTLSQAKYNLNYLGHSRYSSCRHHTHYFLLTPCIPLLVIPTLSLSATFTGGIPLRRSERTVVASPNPLHKHAELSDMRCGETNILLLLGTIK